jgi:uncharacterized protein YuzE
MQMVYFEQEDILHIMAAAGPEAQSFEIDPGITLEMDYDGQVLGFEIENASQQVPDLLARLAGEMQTAGIAELEYQLHEGPDDAAGDEELLAEALEMLRAYKRDKSGWKSLEDFEAELSQKQLRGARS